LRPVRAFELSLVGDLASTTAERPPDPARSAEILSANLRAQHPMIADLAYGGYVRPAYGYYEGEYLCVRPAFSDPTKYTVYPNDNRMVRQRRRAPLLRPQSGLRATRHHHHSGRRRLYPPRDLGGGLSAADHGVTRRCEQVTQWELLDAVLRRVRCGALLGRQPASGDEAHSIGAVLVAAGLLGSLVVAGPAEFAV
jgi:hypothetical protein